MMLFFIACLLLSFSLKKENSKNPYCKNTQNINMNLDYQDIKQIEYKVDCSTIYFYVELDDSIDKKKACALLYEISDDASVYELFIHFEVSGKSLSKIMYASYDYKMKELYFIGG